MRGLVRVVPGLALALALGACGGEDEFERRIAAEPGGLLELDLDRGAGLRPDPGGLDIQAHDANEVRILAETGGWGASGLRLRADRSGDTVRVVGRVRGPLSWMFGGPWVQIQVWVPRHFSLDLRATHGPIRIEDTRGRVRARTEGAEIEVSGVEGALKLRTSGEVRVSEIDGPVDVKLESGGIEVRWVRGDVALRPGRGASRCPLGDGRIEARSDRGAIELDDVSHRVDARTERGSIHASFSAAAAGRLETRRGSVEAVLPHDASVRLDAVARRGSVEVEEGLRVPGEHSESRVAGPVNGGGPVLRLYTARGSVRVREH